MENILSRIEKKMKRNKITKRDLAKVINVSTATITNYFKGKYRFNFIKFTEIIEFLYEDTVDKQVLYLEFCKKASKEEFLYEAAEWFKNNGDFSTLDELIKIYENHKIFFKLQRELLNITNRKSNPEELYFKLEEIPSRQKLAIEEICLLNLTKVYCLTEMTNFSLIPGHVKLIQKSLKLINNDYVRFSFNARMITNLAISKLRKNELTELRKIAEDFLKNDYNKKFKPTYNYFLQILAESYVFEDYAKSKEYIILALEHFKNENIQSENKNQVLKATYDFIKIQNNDYEDLFLESFGERVYFYIKTNQLDKARYLLDKKEDLTAFQLFYKYLVTKNDYYKYLSIRKFVENGDFYYLRIVENH